jgi:hypothetical protein
MEPANFEEPTRVPLTEKLDSDRQLELFKADLQRELAAYKANLVYKKQAVIGIWRAVFEYAQLTIRSMLLANGGGALAILTFLGNYLEKSDKNFDLLKSILAAAAVMFALGVASAVLASAFAYLSQVNIIYEYHKTGELRFRGKMRYFAIGSTYISLILFLAGLGVALYGFWAR